MIIEKAKSAQELRDFCKRNNIKCVETEDQVKFDAHIWGNRCHDYSHCTRCDYEIWDYYNGDVFGTLNRLDLKQISVVIQPLCWNRKDEAMFIFECPKCFERLFFHCEFARLQRAINRGLNNDRI